MYVVYQWYTLSLYVVPNMLTVANELFFYRRSHSVSLRRSLAAAPPSRATTWRGRRYEAKRIILDRNNSRSRRRPTLSSPSPSARRTWHNLQPQSAAWLQAERDCCRETVSVLGYVQRRQSNILGREIIGPKLSMASFVWPNFKPTFSPNQTMLFSTFDTPLRLLVLDLYDCRETTRK